MKKNTPDSQPPKSKKESDLELFLRAVTIIIVVIMCGRFAYHLYEYVTHERPLFIEEVIEEPTNVDIRHLSAKAETHRFNENELLLKEGVKKLIELKILTKPESNRLSDNHGRGYYSSQGYLFPDDFLESYYGKESKTLRMARASLTQHDSSNTECLYILANRDEIELIKMLIYAGVNFRGEIGKAALIAAAKKGDEHLIENLIDAGADVKATLKEAEKNKQTECIAVLKRVNKKEKKTRSTSVDKSTRRYSPPKKITLEESMKMYLRNHKAVGKKTNSKQKTGNRKEDKEEETDL